MTSGQVDPHYPFHSRLLTTAEFGSSLLLQGATTKEALSSFLFPSSHSCFVNRGSRIEQLQDLFSTRRARVPTRPTDRLLLAKIRTAAAIFDNQLRRLRARLLNGKPNRKREKLHGSFEQADGSLTFGNCTKTLVVPRASESHVAILRASCIASE